MKTRSALILLFLLSTLVTMSQPSYTGGFIGTFEQVEEEITPYGISSTITRRTNSAASGSIDLFSFGRRYYSNWTGQVTYSFPATTPRVDRWIGNFPSNTPLAVSITAEGQVQLTNTSESALKAYVERFSPTVRIGETNGPPLAAGTHTSRAAQSFEYLAPSGESNPDRLLKRGSVSVVGTVDWHATGYGWREGAAARVKGIYRFEATDAQLGVPPSVYTSFTETECPTNRTLMITNVGAGTMSWQATVVTSNDVPWLTLFPSSGSLQSSQSVALTLTIQPTELQGGRMHQGAIIFTSPEAHNSPRTSSIPVRVDHENYRTHYVNITNAAPFWNDWGDPQPRVFGGTMQGFTVQLEYWMSRYCEAEVVLELLYRDSNSVWGASAPVHIFKADGPTNITITIPPFELPLTPKGIGDYTLELGGRYYPTGDPDRRFGVGPWSLYYIVEGPTNTVTLRDVDPPPAQILFSGDQQEFSATVDYDLRSAHEATLFLQVGNYFAENYQPGDTTTRGSELARSTPVTITRGSGSRRLTVPAFELPDPTYHTNLQFRAVLVTGNDWYHSPSQPVNYSLNQRSVRLVALEVNQTIQDWQNSIPLIAGKPTTVRAHVEMVPPFPEPFPMEYVPLYGSRDGVPLPGSPLRPLNENGAITVTTNAAGVRERIEATLNYRLPTNWLSGNLHLELEWADGTMLCSALTQPGAFPDSCGVDVRFQPMPDLLVKFIQVGWTDGIVTNAPTSAHTIELADRLRAIFPVARLDVLEARHLWHTNDGAAEHLEKLNEQLELMRLTDCASGLMGLGDTNAARRLYYGVLVNTNVGGLALGIPSWVSSGEMPEDPDIRGRNRHAHEMGHCLQRHHAVHTSLGSAYDADGNLMITGACNEWANAIAPDFPMVSSSLGLWPTLGPIFGDPAQIIYGYDHHADRVVNPFQRFELMSYCGEWRWISSFTYTNLITTLLERQGSNAPALRAANPTDYLIVRGLIDRQADTAQFRPFTFLSSQTVLPLPEPGEYTLRLLDAAGGVLEEIAFQPQFSQRDAPAGNPPAPPITRSPFTIPVPFNAAMKRAVLLHEGRQLASRTATPNPPTVRLLSPNGGENIGAAGATLQWSSSDPDGDALTYIVQYSRDNGLSWETLAVDWRERTYQIDPALLRATSEGRVRVIASDGFNTSIDQSDAAFTVLNHGPLIAVYRPAPQAVFTGNQQIAFEATARDLEQGFLGGTNIAWRSSVNGLLGYGSSVQRPASSLTEGAHLITCQAWDNSGMTAQVTVPIEVWRELPPRLWIGRNASLVVLTWPAEPPNLILERSLSLTSANWVALTNAPTLTNGSKQVRLNISGDAQFYRLRKTSP